MKRDRDMLGHVVREAWVRWAKTQAAPKPSWLVPYDELSEPDREADRQIGEAVAEAATAEARAEMAYFSKLHEEEWHVTLARAEQADAALARVTGELAEALNVWDTKEDQFLRWLNDATVRAERADDRAELAEAVAGREEAGRVLAEKRAEQAEAELAEARRVLAAWDLSRDRALAEARREIADCWLQIDMHRSEIEAQYTRITELREALSSIVQWSEAYPLDIFPEPDLKRAHAVLKEHGMGIDAISAYAERHVVEGVGRIARAALEAKP